MKKALSIMKYEFSETIRRPKMLLVLFFLIVVYESNISPLRGLCAKSGLTLNVFEPFVLMCTFSVNIILIPLIFAVMLSDFPSCKSDYFRMVRISRRSWAAGEIMFIVLISFVMMFALLIGTILPIIDAAVFSNEWGGVMTSLIDYDEVLFYDSLNFMLDATILIHSLPLDAMIYSFLIMWLNLIVSVLLMLLGTIVSKRMAFFSSTLAITFIGGCLTEFTTSFKWVFPIAHTQLGRHYNSIFSKVNFPLFASYIYLAAAVIALIIICGRLVNKTMFIGESV